MLTRLLSPLLRRGGEGEVTRSAVANGKKGTQKEIQMQRLSSFVSSPGDHDRKESVQLTDCTERLAYSDHILYGSQHLGFWFVFKSWL